MAIVRQLLFQVAWGGYRLENRYVASADNGLACALSRGDLAAFRRWWPDAAADVTPLPEGWAAFARDPALDTHDLTSVRL